MIIAYAKSDIGKAREMNQDAYYISDSSSEIKLYLLADGMGGYKGGEIARFARFEKGEGIEKKEENFAEEVMKQLK